MPDCLFCKIIAGQIPAGRVYEDEHAVAIRDINPQAPVHLLVMPRKHFAGVHEVPQSGAGLFSGLFSAVAKVVVQEKLGDYRLVINSGEKAGQSVPHIHVHVLSGRSLQWPPG